MFEISTTYLGRSINATVSIWAMTSDTCDASIACTLTESINRLSHRRWPYERARARVGARVRVRARVRYRETERQRETERDVRAHGARRLLSRTIRPDRAPTCLSCCPSGAARLNRTNPSVTSTRTASTNCVWGENARVRIGNRTRFVLVSRTIRSVLALRHSTTTEKYPSRSSESPLMIVSSAIMMWFRETDPRQLTTEIYLNLYRRRVVIERSTETRSTVTRYHLWRDREVSGIGGTRRAETRCMAWCSFGTPSPAA